MGTALAAHEGLSQAAPALAALAGAVLIQVGTNYTNDVLDYRRGADTAERLGPPRAVQSGWVSAEAMARAAIIAFALAAVAGLYLVTVGGWPILVIGLTGIAAGVAYTAGPRPLAYVGLGDVFVLVYFGVAAVAATAYLQTGEWDPAAAVLGGATGAFAVALLTVNNVRDRPTDEKAGKRTLVVRMGETRARRYYALLLAAAMILTAVLALGRLGPVMLAGLLVLPEVVRVAGMVLGDLQGRALNPILARTVRLQLVHAGLVAAALLATAR